MADMTIPAGWTKYDSGPDYVVYRRTGHTSAVPRLVKFKRTPSSGSTSKYVVTMVNGNADQDADELRNTLITLDIRNVNVQLAADVATALGELATLIGTAGFADDATVELDLPL
jgi:hypothetical protein